MSFHDLFAWFAKNHGDIHTRRCSTGKSISCRIGRHIVSTVTAEKLDSDEFGAKVAVLLGELYASIH